MPSLTHSITQSIRDYPSLFSCRSDVLMQYFCVNGNGLRWSNGELAGDEPDYRQRYRVQKIARAYLDSAWMSLRLGKFVRLMRPLNDIVETEKAQLAALGGYTKKFNITDSKILARQRHWARYRRMIGVYRVENAEDLALISWSHPLPSASAEQSDTPYHRETYIYPLCEYSLMASVPDDVKDDWLAGVVETIFLVFASTTLMKSHHMTEEQAKKIQQKNIEFAEKVLQELIARFGNRINTKVRSYEEYFQNKIKGKQMVSGMLAKSRVDYQKP